MFNARDEEKSIAQKWATAHDVDLEITSDGLDATNVDSVKGFDGITLTALSPVEPVVYEKLKEYGIKQFAQRSAGFDAYDLDLATKNDLIVSNVAVYSPESIAEFTVTIGLALLRHTRDVEERVNKGNYSWTPNIRGRVLGEMKVAVIGTGHIGRLSARLFHAFGCEVVGYDIYQNDGIKDILTYKDSIKEAVADADIVTLHVPLMKENHHVIDADCLAHFKKGAYLLNMARGGLVDTEALLAALDNGALAGAGLDTYEFEDAFVPKNLEGQPVEDDLFKRVLDNPKVIYTPHVAFYTDEAVKNMVEGGLNAALEVVTTGTTKFRVN